MSGRGEIPREDGPARMGSIVRVGGGRCRKRAVVPTGPSGSPLEIAEKCRSYGPLRERRGAEKARVGDVLVAGDKRRQRPLAIKRINGALAQSQRPLSPLLTPPQAVAALNTRVDREIAIERNRRITYLSSAAKSSATTNQLGWRGSARE